MTNLLIDQALQTTEENIMDAGHNSRLAVQNAANHVNAQVTKVEDALVGANLWVADRLQGAQNWSDLTFGDSDMKVYAIEDTLYGIGTLAAKAYKTARPYVESLVAYVASFVGAFTATPVEGIYLEVMEAMEAPEAPEVTEKPTVAPSIDYYVEALRAETVVTLKAIAKSYEVAKAYKMNKDTIIAVLAPLMAQSAVGGTVAALGSQEEE